METFKILNENIDFEEDLPKCANVYLKKQNCIDIFTKQYNNEKMSNVNNTKELIAYMQKMLNIIDKGIDDTTNAILNIFVENKILDKSAKDIRANCEESVQKCTQYMLNHMTDIEKSNQIYQNALEDIKYESAIIADNSVQGSYLNVWSSSMWSLMVADLMNLKEEQKVERKKERIYNKNVNVASKELQRIEKDFCIERQKTLQTDLYKYGLLAIEELFIYCMTTLIEENKIVSSVTSNLLETKSLTIIQNIEKLQDKTAVHEQLIVALKAYPFSKEVHSKILEYITDDIEEYIKMIKFLKCEDIVAEICLTNTSNKYMKILKILGGNLYLQKYLDTLKLNSNNDIAQEIHSTRKQFEILKNIWDENNSTIIQKEKNIFTNIVKRIETKYNAKYTANIEDLNYEVLKDFLDYSKQTYIMSTLKKQKRRKKLTTTFWILFALWNLLLRIGNATPDIYFVTDTLILLIYMIIHNILKAIRQYKEQKNS